MEISGLQALVLIHENPLIPHAIVQPSVLEQLCGQPAIIYTTTLLESLRIPITLFVDANDNQSVSATKELQQLLNVIQQHHGDTIQCITQEHQGASVNTLASALAFGTSDDILVMQGRMPLLSTELLNDLYKRHKETNAAISFVIAHNDLNVIGYDNIISSDNIDSCYVHAGIFIIKRSFLKKQNNDLDKKSAHKTGALAALITQAQDQQETIATVTAPFDSIRAIHTFQELWAVEQIKRSSLVMHWMNKGIRFAAPQTVHIDLNVTIGAGSYIGSGVHLFGATTIGIRCQIHAFSILEQVTLGDNSTIYSHCVMKKSSTGVYAQIGPFAHVNGGNRIGDHAIIGNFVEIKRSSIGIKTKVKHLSYLGDAQVGNEVNIGAGTITCNHDGFTKHSTTIENNAYIGTNTTLVAPLRIGHDAFTAAGSTITKDVPSYALALARTRQINKEGYVHVLREKKQKAGHKKNIPPSISSSSADENGTRAFIGAVKPSPENNSADHL